MQCRRTTTSYSLQLYIPCFLTPIMNSFRKIFQKLNDDQKMSLKHSKSMPYEFSSEGRKREPRKDAFKPAHGGKTPLKKSDIVYVEQAPGMLEIYHGKLSQHVYYHGPTRANVETRADLLAKFPYSPQPTEGLPRTGFRALSLKATVDQASVDALRTPNDHIRSGRLAERVRARSSTDRSNIPPPLAPAPPLPTTRALHTLVPGSPSVNIREVLSHVTVPTPAPAYPRSHWPYSQYDEISHEQDPTVLRGMINRYPLAPVCKERCPDHMRPMHLDMDEPHSPEKTIQWYIHMALAERRPLDVRAGGRYRRIVDVSNMGIV
ncbi:uncharacterized protein BJ212DRAFT_652179 [Suillus subaureus]|uniref:Uncharacterized protein n=1 Tax=Suillus subaureus TaxID=48587 RepID=A0A9P7E0Y6_9AGAM|nr:uncharacterized protein BJ212DRAFT_652179 [Suillus subaureus]KAG1808371.1 hypothetical protein BJ212DRAFT_652179 [Suillus subaureus]